MGPHFMLLLSIYVLYSNVTYISCIMSCGNKIVSNCFKIVSNCFKIVTERISDTSANTGIKNKARVIERISDTSANTGIKNKTRVTERISDTSANTGIKNKARVTERISDTSALRFYTRHSVAHGCSPCIRPPLTLIFTPHPAPHALVRPSP